MLSFHIASLGVVKEVREVREVKGVKGVRADTLVYDIVTKVSALAPKPTWRLITPFNPLI